MPEFSRRTLLSIAPTIATLIASEAGVEAQQNAPSRVSKEQLKASLEILGLDFSEAQRDQMLAGVNRALGSYEALRKVDVPLDTEPAFHFRLALLSHRFEGASFGSFFRPRSRSWLHFKDPEELCFLPVTELAALVRARKITSTDLT